MKTEEAQRVIESFGGQAEFSRLSGINIRAVREVYSGRNKVSSVMEAAIRKTEELEKIKVTHEALVQALRVIQGI